MEHLSSNRQETDKKVLDRINFAINLREYGMDVDFEDWDGLSDYEILGLVGSHYPQQVEIIVKAWKLYCNSEENHEV